MDRNRASSVKINIEQHHDNKAYHDSVEELDAGSKVLKENFDNTVENDDAAGSRNGQFSYENVPNGEHSEETSGTVGKSGANFEENIEMFAGNSKTRSSESNDKDGTKFWIFFLQGIILKWTSGSKSRLL